MSTYQRRIKPKFNNFEGTLAALLGKAEREGVSLRTFFTISSGLGKMLLLVVLCIPCSQFPIISMPFGILIAYLGLRLSFYSTNIWLPSSLLRRKIPRLVVEKIVEKNLHLLKIMKRWTKPRYTWSSQQPFVRKLNGLVIALIGVSIAISPPLPLFGYLSSIAIFLIVIGMLNDDGLYTIGGYLLSSVYFTGVLLGIKYVQVGKILERIRL